jgi:hypothetical protein
MSDYFLRPGALPRTIYGEATVIDAIDIRAGPNGLGFSFGGGMFADHHHHHHHRHHHHHHHYNHPLIIIIIIAFYRFNHAVSNLNQRRYYQLHHYYQL